MTTHIVTRKIGHESIIKLNNIVSLIQLPVGGVPKLEKIVLNQEYDRTTSTAISLLFI